MAKVCYHKDNNKQIIITSKGCNIAAVTLLHLHQNYYAN